MPFITPKTDWAIQPAVNGMYQGDWFEADPDYNRIVNNLMYVRDLLYNAGVEFIQLVSMIPQIYSDYPYENILNALEQNVYLIGTNIPGSTYSTLKTWVANGAAPDVNDLNRWEQCIQDAFDYYTSIINRRAVITSDGYLLTTSDGYAIITI
jgi:hypothetical protein